MMTHVNVCLALSHWPMHTRTYILNALFQTLAAVALLGSPVSTCSLPFHANTLKHGSISFPIRLSFHHFPRLTLVSANSRRISFSSSTKRFRPQLGSFHDEIGQAELHISCNLEHFQENCLCSWVLQTCYCTHTISYLQIQWKQKCWKLSMLSLHKLVWQSQSVHFDLLYNSLQFSSPLSISWPAGNRCSHATFGNLEEQAILVFLQTRIFAADDDTKELVGQTIQHHDEVHLQADRPMAHRHLQHSTHKI